MKNKLIYSLSLLFLFTSALFAQNNKQAGQIVADFIKSVEQNAVQADFSMTILDEDDDPAHMQSGKFSMKKNKFSLLMEDVNIFFDGKTQWAYVASNNEVTITEPSEDELAEINPIFILREYQNKSSIDFSSSEKSNENYIIEMIPAIASDFEKILVGVNKSTENIVSVKLFGKDSFSVLISFSKFQQGLNIPDNAFVFDKSKYKDVFENDLR